MNSNSAEVKAVAEKLETKLSRYFGVAPSEARKEQLYKAVVMSIRDIMLEKRHNFHTVTKAAKAKKVYYLCMEFLMGRSLKNSVFNLGLTDVFQDALKDYDVTLEELWKALPDYVNGAGNTICVADGSGSMKSTIGETTISCLEVANALAIYFSERSSGQFKDQYITFSENPQIVDFHNAKTLREKLLIARGYNEVADTNIEAVFDLILTTAVKKRMRQDELPTNILILSDMEFDDCAYIQDGVETYRDWWSGRIIEKPRLVKPTDKLFKVFEQRYAAHGYKLPRLVFWNICGRTGTIPVKENDLGVALVSGFSPAIAKMVLSNSTDPFECLLEQLNSPRYDAVDKALVI